MPTKTARRDYNGLLPGFVTSQTQTNPAPGNMQQRNRETNILWVSIGLKLISNIDDAIVYNTTGAHAEVRGRTFRRALEAV